MVEEDEEEFAWPLDDLWPVSVPQKDIVKSLEAVEFGGPRMGDAE